MPSVPGSERLLAMMDALTQLTAVAMDPRALADVVAANLARLDGASGAAVHLDGDARDIMVVCDPALARLDARQYFPKLLQRVPQSGVLHVPDTSSCEDCDQVVARTLKVRSVIAASLCAGQEKIGMLWVYSSQAGSFREEDPEMVERFVKIVASVVQLSMQFNDKLRESRTDDLTGLQNRRAYDETLRHMLAESTRYDTPLILVIADLDSFKSINDRFGHVTGDTALIGVANIMQRMARGTDQVFRIGGDEFAVLMPHAGAMGAKRLMSRIMRRLGAARFEFGRLSLSYGFADAQPDDTAASLHERADRALYASKHARTP